MDKKWIKLTRAYDGHPEGERLQLDRATADTLIKAGVAEEAADAETELLRTALGGLTEGVKVAVNKIVDETNAATARITRIDLVESQADKTRSLGDFLQHVVGWQKHKYPDSGERLSKVYKTGWVPDEKDEVLPISRRLQEASGAAGGFRVPDEFEDTVLKFDVEENVFADLVTEKPMSGPVLLCNALRQTTNPTAGQTAMFGGVKVYRKSEKATRTSSEPQWDQIRLEATDLIGYTEFTRDLVADAPGLQSEVGSLFQGALGWKAEYEFLRGDGVGKPLGVFNAPCLIKVTRTNSNQIIYADVVAMMASMMARYWSSFVWVANVTTFPQIASLKDSVGNNVFISSANAGATLAPAGTLMGRPIRWTEKVPALGSTSDLSALAPKGYLHGKRAGVEIGISEDFLFDTDGVAFRVKMRNDGQPWLKSTIKQADGSNTAVSPFVTLN